MKHLNETLTAAGGVMAIISAVVLFQVTSVLAEHDKDAKAHPELIQAIRDNHAAVELLSQKLELGQEANEKDHERQEKGMEQQQKGIDKMTNLLITLVENSS